MKWWTTLGLDLLVVLSFAVIGRLSHGEAADPAGIATVAWPFTVALVGTTIALIGMKRPTDQVLNGALAWVGTLGFGMWIRATAGAGVQVSFVVVAGIFLAVLMVGWRLLAARRRTASAAG
ncbi:DUF3054 domain-containing protein [Micropruina sp.]|uniref:DUF3054 domain-containing protein n=1 Tax=Micropruina sp. TaxID=2737536 RepID=UPI0039E2DE52